MEGETQEQTNNRPWLYKKGQSGNPSGRPKGSISMKEYVKNKLATMTPEEREIYLEGVDKKVIWEMAEGKARQDTDITSGGEKIQFNIVTYENHNNSIPVQSEELPVGLSESTTEIQDSSAS